ncbi:peptidoglycan editing factor PgeF [Sulfurovum sp.]|uniref:peptidoglycan editing factor PgeF n=1 Tax=Sulfurovum sp. TaxID=1969726 RepID=UPI0025F3ACF9|nr:peptidoglycan editing factor PgeF [Sulfurovum sp.]
MIDFYRFEHFQKYKELLHAVTTKSMGSPYEFSLALHTGEDQQEIIQNRTILSSLLAEDKQVHFVVADQTHSDHIKVIKSKETKGWQSLEDAVEDSDALITNVPDVVLTILTADCVPVLLYDERQKVVAAVHAGWKGTKKRIVAKTIVKMTEIFGCDPEDIIAGIAPSVGRCCYEVDRNVAGHFFDIPESFASVGEKFMLDLPLINKKQLLDAGIKKEHIEMSGICTSCEVDRFFSYRKEQGCSGRFMSMIGLI